MGSLGLPSVRWLAAALVSGVVCLLARSGAPHHRPAAMASLMQVRAKAYSEAVREVWAVVPTNGGVPMRKFVSFQAL